MPQEKPAYPPLAAEAPTNPFALPKVTLAQKNAPYPAISHTAPTNPFAPKQPFKPTAEEKNALYPPMPAVAAVNPFAMEAKKLKPRPQRPRVHLMHPTITEVVSLVYYHPIGWYYDNDKDKTVFHFGIKTPFKKGFQSLEDAHNFLALKGYHRTGNVSKSFGEIYSYIYDHEKLCDDTRWKAWNENEWPVIEMKKTSYKYQF